MRDGNYSKPPVCKPISCGDPKKILNTKMEGLPHYIFLYNLICVQKVLEKVLSFFLFAR